MFKTKKGKHISFRWELTGEFREEGEFISSFKIQVCHCSYFTYSENATDNF